MRCSTRYDPIPSELQGNVQVVNVSYDQCQWW